MSPKPRRPSEHPEEPLLDPPLEALRHLWRFGHLLERVSCQMKQTIGVTAQQRFVLRCIGRHPGMTVGQLAELLCLDAATVSVSINRLEREGLATRICDPKDRRRSLLGLTPSGRKATTVRAATIEGAVEEAIDQLSKSERAAVVRAFELVCGRLLAIVEAEGPPSSAGRKRPG